MAAKYATALVALLSQTLPVVAAPGKARSAAGETNWLPDYEYIVVGSGPGGGPVAANLAIAGFKVLLIDAGVDTGSEYQQQAPALQLQSVENESTMWSYFVNHYADETRQAKDSKMTYNTTNGELYVGLDPPAGATPLGINYPRAGSLGGCAIHNALITVLPHDNDWLYLQNLTGDDSWAPNNMRTYFEKLESNHYLPASVVGHGYSGWLSTQLTSLLLVVEDQKLLSLIISAASAMGKSLIGILAGTVFGLGEILLQDINAPGQVEIPGMYQIPLAMSNGVRDGPRQFVLNTAAAVNSDGSRKYQLDIRLGSLVNKIRFENNGTIPRAVGVDFLDGMSLYRADPRSGSAVINGTGSVNATREVIISAGSFNTPQLLKLSGVGPADELQKWNIPVVVDLPGVGTNLQDRYETTIIGETTSDFFITEKCTFMSTPDDPCLDTWIAGSDEVSKGTYATNGIALGIISKSTTAGADTDLFVSGAPGNFKGYYPGFASAAFADAKHWSWIVLKAHSRNNAGTVMLRSTDPRDTPIITFNSFDTGVTTDGAADKDLEAVYEAMEYSRRAFADLIPLDGSFTEVWPGANVSTEAEMKEFIQNEAWGHHASCTCPIGADGDPMAVLDSSFRVRGTQSLRVVDASAFAKIPGFYISLPLYIMSEKASAVIISQAE